jgi:hypothetical protein
MDVEVIFRELALFFKLENKILTIARLIMNIHT